MSTSTTPSDPEARPGAHPEASGERILGGLGTADPMSVAVRPSGVGVLDKATHILDCREAGPASLAQLAALSQPPVSKSGLSHRMKKLESLAAELQKRRADV